MKSLLVLFILITRLSAQAKISAPSEIRCIKIYGNTLFVGTQSNGILQIADIYSPDFQFTPVLIPGLPEEISDFVLWDSTSYVATPKGLFVVRNNQIAETFNASKGLASDRIMSVEISGDGTLWIGMDKGLGMMSKGQYKFFNDNLGLLGNEIRHLSSDASNRIWAVTDEGISSGGGHEFKTTAIKNANGTVQTEHGVIVSAGKSVFALQDGRPVEIGKTQGNVLFMASDVLGRIWILDEAHLFYQALFQNEKWNWTAQSLAYSAILGSLPEKICSDVLGNKFFVAKNLLLKKSESNPEYRDELRKVADENLMIGRYAQAKSYYDLIGRAGAVDDESYYYNYARALENLGDVNLALAKYEQCLSKESELSTQANFNIAKIYLRLNDAKAHDYLMKVREADTSSLGESAAILLAESYLSKGDTTSSALAYDYFISHYSASTKIWEIKAILAEMKKNDQSIYTALIQDIFDNSNHAEIIYRFKEDFENYRFEKLVRNLKVRAKENPSLIWSSEYNLTCSYLGKETMWFGTTNGLYRVNLTSLTASRITTDSGLAHNNILDVFLDTKGTLWVASGAMENGKDMGGISKLENGKWTRFTIQQGFKTNKALRVTVAGAKIWVANDQGLFVAANSSYMTWTKVPTAPSGIKKIFVDNLDKLWFMAGNEIYTGSVKFEKIPFEDSTVQISNFYLDEIGGKVASTNKGIFKFENGRFKLFLENKEHLSPTSYLIDPAGQLYMTFSDGYTRQTELLALRYDTSDGLPSNKVQSVKIYRDKTLFVTDRGIQLFKESARDTLKLFEMFRKETDSLVRSANWTRLRQLYRIAIKNNYLEDYFVYQLGLSFALENKPTEALNYFNDYIRTRGKSPNINEYTFFQILKTFERNDDFDRADAIVQGMIRAFSSQSRKTDLQLDDPNIARCDLSLEKNSWILNLPHRYIALARGFKSKPDKILQTLKQMRLYFTNHSFNDARRLVQEAVSEGLKNNDVNNVLKAQRTRFKLFKDSTEVLFATNLFLTGTLYLKTEQYKDASSVLGELARLPSIRKLRPEIERMAEQARQIGDLGLRVGSGYNDANSANAMEFEGNFLWLGTSKGVIRWDMTSGAYKKFTSKNGLIADYINSLVIDSNNGKWFVGSNLGGQAIGGVSYYDGDKFTNYTVADGLASNQVKAITLDKNNHVWIGTDRGVSYFAEGKWTNYDLKKIHEFTSVTDLVFDQKEQLWIAMSPIRDYESTSGGVIKFDPIKPIVYLKKTGLTSTNVKSITLAPDGRLWFGTDNGVSIYSGSNGTWSHLTTKDGLASNVVRNIDFERQIWLATDNGITKFPSSLRSASADATSVPKSYSEKDGLVSNDIRIIKTHPEFGTWVGSKRGSFSIGNQTSAEEAETSGNKKLFEVSVESEALFEKAQLYLEQGDYDKAREVYLDVLDRVANSEWADDATYLLAKSYELEGKYDEAEKTYGNLVKNYPESDLIAGAYIGLGSVFEKTLQFEKAEAAFNSARVNAKDKSTLDQANILEEKVKVKRISSAREKTTDLATLISQKYVDLEKATTDAERNKLKSEIAELEGKANKSAKAGGFSMLLYKVRERESLWYLSEKFLGDPQKWRDFFVANDGKISDANMIYVGQTIVVLTVEKGYKENLDKFLTYETSAGEDLETIAQKLYGSKDKWRAIFEANKEKLTESPKKSLPKIKLVIPIQE